MTTPDRFGKTTAIIGISLAFVYAIGFLVANTYFGAHWIVDPSLLQARYASAGILWLVFLVSSLVPVYYALSFWKAWREGVTRDEAGPGDHPFSRSVARYRLSTGWKRWIRLLSLVGLTVALSGAILIFVGPILPASLLGILGVHPNSVLTLAASFHVPVLLVAILHYASGMTVQEQIDFRNNPHRAVTSIGLLIAHAVLFGHFIYPAVPANTGGAKPLPARLVVSPDASVWLEPYFGTSQGVIEGAYVVTSTETYLIALIPISSEGSVADEYCAAAIKHDQVYAILMGQGYSFLRPSAVASSGDHPWVSSRVRGCP